MGSMSKVLVLLTMMFVASSALDMSIISYDEARGEYMNPSGRTDEDVMGMYEKWIVKHGKNYNALGEKEKRFEIFKDNLRFIDQHNSQNLTYKLGLNRFADLTNEEYRSIYLGRKIHEKRNLLKAKRSDRYTFRVGDSLPDSVDWREKGAVAQVKDQGSCAIIPALRARPAAVSMRMYCFAWGCCPLEGATCCDDHYSCCPHDYPVCNVDAGTCLMSKGNPVAVKAMKRTPAKPHWAFRSKGSSSA
ncbi:LOW QUALITY PROTEIN: Granulin [Dillenia turbinata]|uniref:Granulin n=1 Tax=Dillenia turbinata TaxID=194707 RepID=A0AAN8VZJ3_9MAGN